jgi:hypothetical protein
VSALDDLQAVMFQWKDRLSVIKPKLDCKGIGTGVRWWRLQLVEESDDDTQFYTKRLDESVKWTEDQLKDWPLVKRIAFDMWDFKHRRDAEKFITLFHLSWDQ